MTRFGKVIAFLLTIYSVCFVGAAFNHARDIMANGILPHSGRPVFCHLFWTSLTFVDPLVPILLLLGRVKPALLIAIGIMLSDVAVNTWYAHRYLDSTYLGNMDLIAQTVFLVYVLCTAPMIWLRLRALEDRNVS